MNYEEQIEALQSEISGLKNTIDELTNQYRLLGISMQSTLHKNDPIDPGVYSKVSFDANGLVTRGDILTTTDIPQLNTSKISGLSDFIESAVTREELSQFEMSQFENVVQRVVKMSPGTATKVTFDMNGLIIDTDILHQLDIPEIPITRVEYLNSRLVNIEDTIKALQALDTRPNIDPGTKCKITYDEHGYVLGGTGLSIDDIPIEFTSTMNDIKQSVLDLHTEIRSKVTENNAISPGTYTKVSVDYKGLVTKGSQLSTSDLPEISIYDIDNLPNLLSLKASVADVLRLSEDVSNLNSNMVLSSTIQSIRDTLLEKTNNSDFISLYSQVQDIVTEGLAVRLLEDVTVLNEKVQLVVDDHESMISRISTLEIKVDEILKVVDVSRIQ